MSWVGIALACLLAVPLLFLLILWLLRFRLAVEFEFLRPPRASLTLSFLWLKRVFVFGDDGREGVDVPKEPPMGPLPGSNPLLKAQAGFLGVNVPRKVKYFRRRLRRAGMRLVVDPPAWGLLLGYLRRSGIRLLRWFAPHLDFLHVGAADVVLLGRFAGTWSAVTGMVPALACPVEYGFNEQSFALRLRGSGGGSGLGLLGLAAILFITIPWTALASRFRQCWRNPRLNRWQRRLLLH